jgi:hypothetical protein
MGRDKLSRLVGKIEEDCARFKQCERRAARPAGVIDCRNFAVGVEREKGRVVVFVRHDVDPVRLVSEARFLEHDADLHPIGRRQGKELQPIGVLRRPTHENRMIECHFLAPKPIGTYEHPGRFSKTPSWVHPGFRITLA